MRINDTPSWIDTPAVKLVFLLVAIAGLVAIFVVPEVRRLLGLDPSQTFGSVGGPSGTQISIQATDSNVNRNPPGPTVSQASPSTAEAPLVGHETSICADESITFARLTPTEGVVDYGIDVTLVDPSTNAVVAAFSHDIHDLTPPPAYDLETEKPVRRSLLKQGLVLVLSSRRVTDLVGESEFIGILDLYEKGCGEKFNARVFVRRPWIVESGRYVIEFPISLPASE